MAGKGDGLKARLPRGLADRGPADIRATEAMLATIRSVYERYGFEPVETPLIEYSDALGKFLPDQDRPNEGVFSFRDDDEDWLSLRYDLTAPLARHVAENYERLPKPYRSYRAGWVFRNEKPGPGRFRQFMQFDADTVGASSPAADAEMCMMAADALEALGIERGQYVIKVSNRKIFEGVLEAIQLTDIRRRLGVLRAIDKYDRLGLDGVRQLLGKGRKDESGDFTKGAELDSNQMEVVLGALTPAESSRPADDDAKRGYSLRAETGVFNVTGGDVLFWRKGFPSNKTVDDAFDDLKSIEAVVRAAGYGTDRIRTDPYVVRGLEYYTGAVFEAELLFPVPNEQGQPVVFGSVGGGGRYDGLVGRFGGQDVPATGFSIGVSRLQAALKALGKSGTGETRGPVVVLVMDRAPEALARAQRFVAELRRADLRDASGAIVGAELYLGDAGMKAQLKYADKRNSPCVVIQGGDEVARGVVQIKDLAAGKALAASLASHDAYREGRPGQFEVPEGALVEKVRELILRGGA
ncbi:MAG: histidine--tRNA ligase [Bauldia sp.]